MFESICFMLKLPYNSLGFINEVSFEFICRTRGLKLSNYADSVLPKQIFQCKLFLYIDKRKSVLQTSLERFFRKQAHPFCAGLV